MIALNETSKFASVSPDLEKRRISGGMEVFLHHFYEYKKGLRNLVLHTCYRDIGYGIICKLEHHNIEYLIYPLGKKRINVFFGNTDCLEIVRRIGKLCLSRYTAEEDFILGIMLGYDRCQQCERYLRLKQTRNEKRVINHNNESKKIPASTQAVSQPVAQGLKGG
ncbi:hypothetical protein L21SP3_01667 [Sedimentisphaera cyanobacteriorum]|uniref:DUF2023 domain-containing protein n=2 Tax=Sedimentisphaera cyanobacteriorum TaxID=1940790 RepID=A0A1Q2HQW8_9BACT|nr:hypothetical protein L21SP3_01667 [Sedimentisphaera cyanobacteriorum]